MAAALEDTLLRHTKFLNPISEYLNDRNSKRHTKRDQIESKGLITLSGSDVFIYDPSESQIVFFNLKNVCQQNSSDEVEQGQGETLGNKSKSILFQTLIFNYEVLLDVDNITINRCGSHILLWGQKSLNVLELPRRWGKNGMFEGGKETISCRLSAVFNINPSIQLLQAAWHPASPNNAHIAALFSDNTFQVFNIFEPGEPLSVVAVNPGDNGPGRSPSKSLVGLALGETAVAFDFGLPLQLQPRKQPFSSLDAASPLEVWPVYCVRGNGDVLILYSDISSNKPALSCVQGPIMMVPPAEDNYGVDACSIVCLSSPLPVVVIATCEGSLHHCVQMAAEQDSSASSKLVLSPLYEAIPEPVFFVMETAQLELCLKLPGFNDSQLVEEEEFLCPIHLCKDPCSNERYHCSHSAGVHSVCLPWLPLVQQYFLADSGDFSLPEDKECIVEHLVCTKTLPSSELAPVLGLDLVTDLSFGPQLLVLQADFSFSVLPIAPNMSSFNSIDEDSEIEPKPKRKTVPFNQHIAQILQRKTSNPLLKSGANQTMNQQEAFQLISRATQILREEYIQRQDVARTEISTRVTVLQQHKAHQLADLKALLAARRGLQDKAHSLADTLETAKENDARLRARVEAVLRRLQSQASMLSQAEKQMARQLDDIQANAQAFQQSLQQLKLKQEYQDRQMTKGAGESKHSLQPKQLTQIHSVLKDEGNDIQELKNDIRRLSISLN